ncbi:hypothetical protein HQ590_16625 [bacterium]|nr:hypothetical protein [bacterium]
MTTTPDRTARSPVRRAPRAAGPLLLVLSLAVAAGAAGADNLLVNADFAEVTNGVPARWALIVRTNTLASGDVVADPDHGQVLHIRYEHGANQVLWVYQPPVPDPPFVAGVKYRLRAWMKCQLKNRPPPRYGPYLRFNLWGEAMNKLWEIFLTPNGNIRHGELLRLDQLPTEVPWTKLEVVFTAPATTTRWGLNLTTSGVTGDIWVGGLSLAPADPKSREGPFVD